MTRHFAVHDKTLALVRLTVVTELRPTYRPTSIEEETVAVVIVWIWGGIIV
ncbi:MAG: hypothetical protein IH951_13805 [Bacteroidetes bacterium]|nr:hypothetical protein [Bacteroidota bacterium]